MLLKSYGVFGIALLIAFLLATMDGRQLIDPFGIKPSRPTGPGQVHK